MVKNLILFTILNKNRLIMEEWVQARYLTSDGELLVFTDYEVSNLGNVRNKNTGRILSVGHNNRGYCRVYLSINGKRKDCKLHRFVLSSFTDNKDGSLDVNHKDENKDNNTLTNLEWMSHLENVEYSQAKPVLQYDKSGAFIREWPSTMEIERQLGITHQHISVCCKGKLKTTAGYVWCYK